MTTTAKHLRRIIVGSALCAATALAVSACSGPAHHAAATPAAGTAPAATGTPAPYTARGDVAVAHGALADPPFPGGAQVTPPYHCTGDSFVRDVFGMIRTTDGVQLSDGWWHGTDEWCNENVPDKHIGAGNGIPFASRFKVSGFAPGLVAAYQIYDTAGKATDFWIGAKFYSPAAGMNSASCVVYQGNPRSEGSRPTMLSPYTCAWANIRGWFPTPVLTVSSGTVVTDKAQAKELLSEYCNTKQAARDCKFIDFGYGTGLGESHTVGQVVRNDGQTPVRHGVGWADETSASNTVGVSLTNEVNLWEIWTVSLELKYEHTWETSHSFHETTDVEVPSQGIGWIEFAPNMQTTEGTWVINTGKQRYVIPTVGLSAPLPNGGAITVHTCPQTNYHNGTCSAGLTSTTIGQ